MPRSALLIAIPLATFAWVGAPDTLAQTTDGDIPQLMNQTGGTSEVPVEYIIGDTPGYTYTVDAGTSGGDVYFGAGASGGYQRLTIQNSGTLDMNSGDLFIGNTADGNAVIVTGAGSSITNAHTVDMAFFGGLNNSLTIQNAGVVSSQYVNVGVGSGETGNSLTVTGAGSTLTNSFLINVGSAGSLNTMTVSAGATVNTASIWLSSAVEGGNSSITITGAGTTVTLTSSLLSDNYGNSSNSNLTVSDGASFTGAIQLYSPDNTVEIDGIDSIVTASTLRLGTASTTGNVVSLTNGSLLIHGTGSLVLETGNYLQIGDGYFAWEGDHVDDILSLIGDDSLQVSDGASGWMTATGGDLTYQYFNGDDSAAEAFSGYSGLGAYTIIGTVSAVPEPSTYAAIAGACALLATGWIRRRRRQRDSNHD